MPGKRINSLLPVMADPPSAIAALLERVAAVECETVPLSQATGRVLNEALHAERDSPAADVSAVDGYALHPEVVRMATETAESACEVAVAFEVQTGQVPPPVPVGHAARVFTGGVIPAGASAVVKREFTDELPDCIRLHEAAINELHVRTHIRPRGENARADDLLLPTGQCLHPAAIATLATNGKPEVGVYRRVKVGVVISGNEVATPGDPLGDAQVRDSNGPALHALLSSAPWCEVVEVASVPDDLKTTRHTIQRLAESCDAILTTGGVSMGDYDTIPDALIALRADVVYHHLAMRPGKPNLGAVLPAGVPVIALPGNPVSALVGAVVLAGPVLRRRAGFAVELNRSRRQLSEGAHDSSKSPSSLWHYILATTDDSGNLIPVDHRGSGDVTALGRADGVFELPAGVSIEETQHPRWFPWCLSV